MYLRSRRAPCSFSIWSASFQISASEASENMTASAVVSVDFSCSHAFCTKALPVAILQESRVDLIKGLLSHHHRKDLDTERSSLLRLGLRHVSIKRRYRQNFEITDRQKLKTRDQVPLEAGIAMFTKLD